MKRKHWLIAVGALSLLYFVGLLYYAQVRGIDPDEGFYPNAAKLAWEGRIPYRDFMFHQGIIIPYVYSWIWAVHPHSLVSMRFLSVGMGALAVFFWGLCLFSIKRLPAHIALAAFLFILVNPYWIVWHTVVKTFAVSNLLMSAAMICLYFGFQSGRARWYLLAGVTVGACASARGLYVPLVPFVLIWLVHLDWKEPQRRFRRALAYLAGAFCGTLPMIVSFAADPSAFIFNNVAFRRLLDLDVSGSSAQSIHIHLSGIYHLMLRPFFAVEALLAFVGILSFLRLRKSKDGTLTPQDYQYLLLAFLMMLVYTATSLIPVPTWVQYFDSPLLVFLVFFIAEGLRVAYQATGKWAVLFVVLVPILCWGGIRDEAGEFTSERRLHLSSYHQVADIVRANSAPDATVLSVWPGYVFESGRRCFPGAENEFVYSVARRVTPEIRDRYHLVSKDEVLHAVSAAVPDIYIPAAIARYLAWTMTEAERQALQKAVDANYSLIRTVDDIQIYRRRSSPGP
jgi:4-amino-4-deoxy-L-arabinose transferase-like glycosyltransferase